MGEAPQKLKKNRTQRGRLLAVFNREQPPSLGAICRGERMLDFDVPFAWLGSAKGRG